MSNDRAYAAENLAAALELAAAGIVIFPGRITFNASTGRWDKRPYIKGWQIEATADEAQIRQWWSTFPDAVAAIELGRNKLLAIDADRHGGPDGVARLDLLAAQHGGLPAGPVTNTPGDGRHHLFVPPEGETFGNSRGALPDAIDVRGEGGWLVAPGAVRPDGRCWEAAPGTPLLADAYQQLTMPRLPDWLGKIIRAKPGRSNPTEDEGRGFRASQQNASGREAAYAAAALDGCCENLRHARPVTRNNTLNAVAFRMGRMVARGWVDQGLVVDRLWQACVANGLINDDGADAVQKTLASGLTAGVQDPHPNLGERPRSGNGQGPTNGATADDVPDMSIVRRNQLPAPPFPIKVVGPAGEWICATAERKSAPIDFVALSLLVTVAGLLGAKRFVSPWADWKEPSILWGALVGPPSTNKSPATDPLREAVHGIEQDANGEWDSIKAAYQRAKAEAEARHEKWLEDVRKAVKAGDPTPELPRDAVVPPAPTKTRIWVGDATTQKMARLLAENPGGLICYRDELSGLLGGFDRYGGQGSDRAFWVEAFGGRPHRVDVVKLDDAIDVSYCAVSILAPVQPDRLHSLVLTGDDDGFSARFLYAWPDPVPPRRPTRSADGAVLLAVLRRISAVAFGQSEDGALAPRILMLQPEAADEFQAWWERIQWEARREAMGLRAGAIGKLDGLALRLSLVLEHLFWAWERRNSPEPEQVSLQSVQQAIHLIESWVRPSLERVFAEAAVPKPLRDARTVAQWLLKNKAAKLNARDLRRQAGFPGPKEAKELDAALEVLVDAKWLAPAPGREGDVPGRVRKDFWVNIKIYERQN